MCHLHVIIVHMSYFITPHHVKSILIGIFYNRVALTSLQQVGFVTLYSYYERMVAFFTVLTQSSRGSPVFSSFIALVMLGFDMFRSPYRNPCLCKIKFFLDKILI